MGYIHNALPYKQKQVLPLMLPSTTHPTTITGFQISLDTSQDAFNSGHQSFKTVRMISNNFLDKPKQYQSSLSPNVCLPYNKSQPQLQQQQPKSPTLYCFRSFCRLGNLAFALFFWQHLLYMAFSNSLIADAHACKRTSQNPLHATKSIEKVWVRVSEFHL